MSSIMCFFEAGTNREEQWTCELLVCQYEEKVINAFQEMHPGCVGLFTIDNNYEIF